MKAVATFILALAGLTGAAAAATVPVKQNCDVVVEADKFIADDASKTGTWTGNVVVTQCDMKMHADSIRANAVANQADKITAKGHIVVVSEKAGIASGDDGIYDVPKKLITLTGHVILKHDKSVMSGSHLTYNLATGIAQVDAAPSAAAGAGTGNGRVRAVLSAPPPKGN